MKTGVKVGDAMTKAPVIVQPDMSLQEVAKLMLRQKVGGVLVAKAGKLEGIITEKDIVEKLVATNKSAKNTKAKDIMSRKLYTIDPNKDIEDAIIAMRDNDVRRLPVVHDHRLVGILTIKDILAIEPQLFEMMVEKLKLREETFKPTYLRLKYGHCENCGNQGHLGRIGNRLLCDLCKKL